MIGKGERFHGFPVVSELPSFGRKSLRQMIWVLRQLGWPTTAIEIPEWLIYETQALQIGRMVSLNWLSESDGAG